MKTVFAAQPGAWSAWAECLVVTVALPCLGALVRPQDPLMLGSGFSWVLIPPLLVAVRYGCARAILSAATLVILQHALRGLGHGTDMAGATMLGVLAVPGAVGYGFDLARRSAHEALSAHDSLWDRFSRISRMCTMLEISQRRLEHRAGHGVRSLRACLAGIDKVFEANRGCNIKDCAPRILDVFAAYAHVEIAALYSVHQGKPSPTPAGRIGGAQKVAPDDPLVAAAIRTGTVAFRRPGALAHGTTLMAAVPLTDVKGTVVAVMGVQSMPFIAFENDNLRMLSILAGHFGDHLGACSSVAGTRQQLEMMIRRALIDAHQHGMTGALVLASWQSRGCHDELIERVMHEELRETDYACVLEDVAVVCELRDSATAPQVRIRPRAGHHVLAILLRMVDEQRVEAFQSRIQRLGQELPGGASEAGMVLATRAINEQTVEASLLGELLSTEVVHETRDSMVGAA